MFGNGAKRQHWEEGQRRKDVNDKHQNDGKAHGIGMKRTCRFTDKPLFHQRPRNCKLQDDREITAEEHDKTGGNIPEQRVRAISE